MCFGSSGNTTTTTTQKFEPPEWAASLFPEYVNRAYELSNVYGTSPHIIYGNDGQPMVAPMSDLQNKAANATYGMASQGNPNDNLASGYLGNLLNGGQQNIQPDNPYLGANNPYTGATSSYGGNSPQFEDMLQKSNQDITNNFQMGMLAPQSSAAARAGAFGGSQDMMLKNQLGQTLANQIAANTNQQRNDQYNRSAQLEQADLSRNSGLATGDLARNSGLAQNSIQNAFNAYENSAGRQMQGLGAINNQDAMDLARWGAVRGFGDLQQQTQQANINAARDLFNQNVQQPLNALDILGKVLGTASGQGVQTSVTSGPGQSPWASLAGGAMSMLPLLFL
jgi:hypothetical protein